MVRGLFGSVKGILICLAIIIWLVFSVAFMTANFPVFITGVTMGTQSYKYLTSEELVANRPLNGRIHDVTADVTNYYSEYIPHLKINCITESNNIYLVPIDENGTNVFVTVKKGSQTDRELSEILSAKQAGELKDNELAKTGVWVDAVCFVPKARITDIAQDPLNNARPEKITVRNYIIDCTHPYSGYMFRFTFGVFLLIALVTIIFILLKRVKAVVAADERMVKESYKAANRTPPEEKPVSASDEYNPRVINKRNEGYNDTQMFDSSTRKADYYNENEISYGKFQRQGKTNNDDGFFGE